MARKKPEFKTLQNISCFSPLNLPFSSCTAQPRLGPFPLSSAHFKLKDKSSKLRAEGSKLKAKILKLEA